MVAERGNQVLGTEGVESDECLEKFARANGRHFREVDFLGIQKVQHQLDVIGLVF